MSPDSPLDTPNEDAPSKIFAETRASTLIPKTPPTSASETLVPTPENEEAIATIIAPKADASEASAPESQPVEPEPQAVEPQAVEPQTVEPQAVEPQVVELETVEPEPAPVVATPPQPAENPALALTFAPAPDAPFQSSVTVGITCQMPDARIYYTLDGTMPDETSTLYTPERILLTQSVTLSARAVIAGASGPIANADYIVSKPLWQENEPADQADSTLHKISENQTAPDNWQMSAASVRGKLHAHRALWREDSFALGNVGEWSICVVSDGAGSAPLSRVGSRLACDTALENLRASLGAIETLSENINADLPRVKAALVGAAGAALQAIRDQAEQRQQPLNAFAATLLILVRRTVGAAQLCAAIQVGDGAIALDCQSGLKLLGAADHGQHSSETRFLTTNGMENDFANRVKFSLPADLRATLVVSDGVSDDYFPEDKRLTEVFEAVMPLAQNAADAGAALLQWLGYEKKGSSDDRTIALSWPSQVNAVDALETELAQSATDATARQASVSPSEDSSDAETGTSATASEVPAVADDAATAPASTEMETHNGV